MTELCVDQNMHTLLAQQYEPHLMKHLTFCQRASGQLALVNMLLSTENSFNLDPTYLTAFIFTLDVQ